MAQQKLILIGIGISSKIHHINITHIIRFYGLYTCLCRQVSLENNLLYIWNRRFITPFIPIIEQGVVQDSINQRRILHNKTDYIQWKKMFITNPKTPTNVPLKKYSKLMKGKENVLSEVNLMLLFYHIRRLISIFTTEVVKI